MSEIHFSRYSVPFSLDLGPLDCYLWGSLKPLLNSATIANEETINQRTFYKSVKTFETSEEPLKGRVIL